MSVNPKKPIRYQVLNEELEAITEELQREDLDIDVAMEKYQRGLELIQLLETYLKTAENKITELNVTFSVEQ